MDRLNIEWDRLKLFKSQSDGGGGTLQWTDLARSVTLLRTHSKEIEGRVMATHCLLATVRYAAERIHDAICERENLRHSTRW